MKRVAVTGYGLICALGHTVEECWDNAVAGECGIRPLALPGEPPYKFTHGAEVRDFDSAVHFSDKEILILERFAQLCVVAARQAVTQSGLDFSNRELSDATAIITGTGVGGQFSEEEGYRRLYRENNPRVAPLTIPRTMANAAASYIAIDQKIHGPSYTIASACSSSNHAIGQAFRMIRAGEVTCALAGGSEAVFSEGLLRAWEAMRVVSPDVCRPFSQGRRGLSLGEGGGMLVLENWEHAQARGAPILGEIVGFGMSSDAHHVTQPDIDGPAKAMRWALRDANLEPSQVGYINAHGTGTQLNDATESTAIRSVFDSHADRLLVSSTKSSHGHTLGAAGAVEAVLTLLALAHGVYPPTVSFLAPDPACNLNVIPNQAARASLQYALSNTFAFGGLNATLVLARNSIS